MSESYKNARIKFNKKGVQKNYISKVKKVLKITGSKLAKKLDISQRTLSDWAREKFHISYIGAQKLYKISGVPVPSPNIIIKWKEHLRKIGKVGGKNRIMLYGKIALNEEYRNKKWREWWQEVGQYKKNAPGFQSLIKIKIPKKDKRLAEFVGIMLGDGGVAPYHIHITLSNKEKRYIQHITKLIIKLFGLAPKIHKLKYAKAIDIVVQRKQLVDFCQEIGLVLGNKVKQQVDIPQWIKENKSFSKACIRGLIDTDGCFYTNSYYSNRKRYSYFKIAFTSASLPLITSVAEIFRRFGFNARISKNKKDVRIESSEYVSRYINEIGSNNSKHLEKIEKWKNSRNMLK
jgi:transcriptional regulator with XRE-family HTH domain